MRFTKVFLVLFLGLTLTAKAQFLEFGGGIGAMSYAGDLSRGYKPLDSKLAGFGVFRMNFSDFISFRTALAYGSIAGDDGTPIDPLGEVRGHSFNTNLWEFSGVLEYHFLDFRHDKSPINWTPYFFAGIGFMRLGEVNGAPDDFGRLHANIPFGLGFKQLIGRKFAITADIGVRKTFTDYLDGISDSNQTRKDGFQFGHPNTDDWYFFTGISFTYVLYKIPCPFPYIPNRYMFKR